MAKCNWCGAEVLPSEKVCAACGATTEQRVADAGTHSSGANGRFPAIDDCRPTTIAEDKPHSSQHPTLVLQDIRDRTEILVPPPGGAIGRDGDFGSEHFTMKVSRVQLMLDVDECGSAWLARLVGRADTFIGSGCNSIQMQQHETYPLFGGETLRIGDMVFQVNMRAAKPEGGDSDHESHPHEDVLEGWLITCPSCKTVYVVDSEDSRIDECEVCQLTSRRKQVAERSPCLQTYTQTSGVRDRRRHVD